MNIDEKLKTLDVLSCAVQRLRTASEDATNVLKKFNEIVNTIPVETKETDEIVKTNEDGGKIIAQHVTSIVDYTECFAEQFPVGAFKKSKFSTVVAGNSDNSISKVSSQHQKEFTELNGDIIEWLYEVVGSRDLSGTTFCPVNHMDYIHKLPEYPLAIFEFEDGVYTAKTCFV